MRLIRAKKTLSAPHQKIITEFNTTLSCRILCQKNSSELVASCLHKSSSVTTSPRWKKGPHAHAIIIIIPKRQIGHRTEASTISGYELWLWLVISPNVRCLAFVHTRHWMRTTTLTQNASTQNISSIVCRDFGTAVAGSAGLAIVLHRNFQFLPKVNWAPVMCQALIGRSEVRVRGVSIEIWHLHTMRSDAVSLVVTVYAFNNRGELCRHFWQFTNFVSNYSNSASPHVHPDKVLTESAFALVNVEGNEAYTWVPYHK